MATNRTQKVDHLSEVPIFRHLSKRQLQRLAQQVDEVTVEADKMLAEQGLQGRELLIVVDGQATVRRDGREIARLTAGDVIGEMSLIDGKPRSATVTADTRMTLLVIDGRAFKPLLKDVPGMAEGIITALAERLRQADSKLIE